MNKWLISGLLTLSFIGMGCSRDSDNSNTSPNTAQTAPKLEGVYKTSKCFKNKAASAGMGQDVYSKSTLTFNSDKSGEVYFELYMDSSCATLAASGTNVLTYEITKTVESVQVLKVTQSDPNDPNNNSIYWLPMNVTDAGLYVDVDGTLAESGPYDSEPTNNQLADFVADPTHLGIFCPKQ